MQMFSFTISIISINACWSKGEVLIFGQATFDQTEDYLCQMISNGTKWKMKHHLKIAELTLTDA